uniref:Uncharacterized protein n=1 Tax=Anguilla anguilla TaxID=7936 RepID=A0A0E9WNP3_ANGAN
MKSNRHCFLAVPMYSLISIIPVAVSSKNEMGIYSRSVKNYVIF